jgi:hypothetical protein
MIIGVSGKKQSGKDLVSDIIKYCTNIKWNHSKAGTLEHFKQFCGLTVFEQEWDIDWKVVKFADKVKDIVCLLIGCTREQLEDEEFKTAALSKEWNKTIEYLDNHDFPYYSVTKMTPRLLMQLVGTECGRDIIHPDIWVNATMTEYDYLTRWKKQGAYCKVPNLIITDVRFPNELNAVESRDGFVIRVNRPSFVNYKGVQVEVFDVHPSETALDDHTFQYTILNNGTIEELIEKVKEILIKEKIICI